MHRPLGVLTVLLAASLLAHADTLMPFQLNGAGSTSDEGFGSDPGGYSNGNATGVCWLDLTTSSMLSFQLSFNDQYGGSFDLGGPDPLTVGSFLYGSLSPDYNFGYGPFVDIDLSSSGGDFFVYNGEDHLPNGARLLEYYSGSISPDVAATPEPASFLLLGTGLLAFTFAARRRLPIAPQLALQRLPSAPSPARRRVPRNPSTPAF